TPGRNENPRAGSSTCREEIPRSSSAPASGSSTPAAAAENRPRSSRTRSPKRANRAAATRRASGSRSTPITRAASLASRIASLCPPPPPAPSKCSPPRSGRRYAASTDRPALTEDLRREALELRRLRRHRLLEPLRVPQLDAVHQPDQEHRAGQLRRFLQTRRHQDPSLTIRNDLRRVRQHAQRPHP